MAARTANPRLFGAHLSIAGGIVNALLAARTLRFNALQVFVKNQRQWSAPPLAEDAIAAWREERSSSRVGAVVAHAAYLINLASTERSLLNKSRAALLDELQRCDALSIDYLVLHPGSAKGGSRDAAITRVAESLDHVLDRAGELRTQVLLETTAGQGDSLGVSFEELSEIIALMSAANRVAVCGDTCHVFAAGYDLRSQSAYDAMIDEAERTVGCDRIRCWHINDSRGECGSRLDRHAHLGAGAIGPRGLKRVVADPRFAAVPMIIETPKGEDERGRDMDAINVSKLRRWARG